MGAHQRWTSATHQTPRHAELRRPSRPRQRRTDGQALERSANCARGGSRGSSSSQAAPLRRARAGAQQARLGVTVRGAYRRRSELSRTLPGGRDWASGRPDYASRRCSSQPLHFTRGLSQRQRVRETSVASLADSRGEKQAATLRGCSACWAGRWWDGERGLELTVAKHENQVWLERRCRRCSESHGRERRKQGHHRTRRWSTTSSTGSDNEIWWSTVLDSPRQSSRYLYYLEYKIRLYYCNTLSG